MATLALTQMGCSQSSSKDSASVGIASNLSVMGAQAKTTVSSAGVSLSAPEYGMSFNPVSFTLAPPAGASISSATWNYGDGSAVASGPGPMSHVYNDAGSFTVNVSVVDSNGNTSEFSRTVGVLPLLDGFECVTELGIVSPIVGMVGVPVPFTAELPLCVGSRVQGVVWNFGDGTGDTVLSTSHTFAQAGTYHVTIAVSVLGAPVANPMFILSQEIEIAPIPVDPNSCSPPGGTRSRAGESYTEDVACGVDGRRTDTYHAVTTDTCKLKPGTEVFTWQQTSVTKELVSQGQCRGESCELPAEAMTGVEAIAQGIFKINGKYYLSNGGRLTFYSSQSPENACSQVQEVRTCTDGVLSGSSEHKYLLCFNGCSGFGANGTVKTGIVTGEISVPKICQYGETGFSDLFNQISDLTCNLGTVETSNARQGSIKSEGVCPTYKWVGTEEWSACSADCGGSQTLNYVCVDNAGKPAANSRCSGEAPAVTRVCDGNPDAVKRSEVVTSIDEGGSTNSCPRNQIGVISKSREMTVTKTYACIEHSVQKSGEETTYGPWVEENYCREYVAHRCSHDSLSSTQARGRYLWMVKCADKVPVIKEFLEKFDDVHSKKDDYKLANSGMGMNGYGISDSKRLLYPTFMDRHGENSNGQRCDKPWIAPKVESASCEVPSTVYIAAVCLSSCATPEQQIMAKEKANGSMGYVPFVEAWEKKFAFVATLGSQSSMSSKKVQKTRVDQWITELVDSEHVILEFRMASGGSLRLTPNHPLLTADAFMRLASELKVGDQLVRLGGISDQIISITETNYYGKVYNVAVKSAALHKNIVITNGYLNGTAMYQNEGAKFVNTQIFRKHLLRGVFAK